MFRRDKGFCRRRAGGKADLATQAAGMHQQANMRTEMLVEEEPVPIRRSEGGPPGFSKSFPSDCLTCEV